FPNNNPAPKTCHAQFSQRFENFFIGEAPQQDGSSKIREEGKMSVDALGDIQLDTVQPLAAAATPGPTPTPGGPIGILFPAAGSGNAACPNGGDGIFRLRRPPLTVPFSNPAALVYSRYGAPQGRLEHDLFRATNGQVYQVITNANLFATDFKADALQITS